MIVKPQTIRPSQNFLKPKTLAFILECIENGNYEELPPSPIVRRGNTNELVAIDGHNLIAVRLYLGQEIDVHVAENSGDGLAETTDANVQRNQDLRDKFDSVLSSVLELETQGITSFVDLNERYKDILT